MCVFWLVVYVHMHTVRDRIVKLGAVSSLKSLSGGDDLR